MTYSATIPGVPYLLVQEEKSAVYKLLGADHASIHPEDAVQRLLNDARTKICTHIGGVSQAPSGLTLKAYTLVDPIDRFLGRTISDLENQLGDIDETFLRTKAIYWPPSIQFSSLEATDGKLLVIFRTSAKRGQSESSTETIFERLKRTKLVTTSPSTAAKPSIYENIQNTPSEKILDDRPEQDADIPPVSLLYDGFGEFQDIMDGVTDVPGLSDVDMAELLKAVDDFAQKMCRFYDTEDQRRDAALPTLNRIFSARSGSTLIPALHPSCIGSVKTDGHNVGKHGGGGIITAFKNHAANNNAIAEVELVGYVAHLHANVMKDHQKLFERWRVPCLGLTVVGSDVKFFALVSVDHQYRVAGLTPSLSCIAYASDGRDRKALYRAFAAASVVQARILRDAEKFLIMLPPEIPPTARRFPSITRLRKWHGSADDYLSFQIVGFHPDRQPYRLLYVAETTTGPEKETILIKFVREYSIELHDFCAKHNHAPRILAFETLPGGWRVIAMEFIASAVQITSSPGLDTHGPRWASELKQLVHEFHRKDLVHGDLRAANIMISGDENIPKLVDFDWGGKDGQVFYPTPNLNDELLVGRASDSNLKITKVDDIRVLNLTLKNLRR